MLRDEKNLKDSKENSIKDTSSVPAPLSSWRDGSVSYTKTEKLITALYMVTDIMDKDEPLRNKLRTLGTGIISDTHLLQQNSTGPTLSFMNSKIAEIMSFLDIASAVNIISEMNYNILKKEFSELNQSILNSTDRPEGLNKRINLAEFLFEAPLLDEEGVGGGDSKITTSAFSHSSLMMRRGNSKGRTSIGIQKGSTLLKALKHISVSDKNVPVPYQAESFGSGLDELKNQRRKSILDIIKTITGGATIKDIKDKVQASPEKFHALVVCSEKTLQRELMSMVKDNVLNKTGEKRWSRYLIRL